MNPLVGFIRLVLAGGKTAITIHPPTPAVQVLTEQEVEYRENRDRGLVIPIVFPPPLYGEEARLARESFENFCTSSDAETVAELKAIGKL